jgi:Tol biopolymer transport system component
LPAETAIATPVVNGRITSIQGHLWTHVSSYQWLAFDSGSDTGLVVSYRSCRHCRPRGIELARLTVVGPAGPVATLACSDRPPCRARVDGTAATLGPGADEVTVESGDRTIKVIEYDGTLRQTLDLTATLARGQDLRWLAWSPDGSRLAVLTGRGRHGSDIWLVEGDGTPELAYSGNNPWMLRPAWSPDGQRLLVDQLVPRRGRKSFRDSGADVVVFHRSSAGSSPAMTPQVLYRSNRGFDNAGNLAWSPDGTRIAVRTSGGVVEVSAEDGRVLARHPQNRGNSGWLIWLRESDEDNMQVEP